MKGSSIAIFRGMGECRLVEIICALKAEMESKPHSAGMAEINLAFGYLAWGRKAKLCLFCRFRIS